MKPGKGSAFVRCKLKNLQTGSSVDKTFRAGEPLEVAAVEKRNCQFTYTEVCSDFLSTFDAFVPSDFNIRPE